jgi:hypothetical protein
MTWLTWAEQTFEGRTHPSQEKIQHLIHLDDRRKRAQDDMASNSRQIEIFVSCVSELASAVPNVDEALGPLRHLDDDIEYIDKELVMLGQKITELQTKVSSTYEVFGAPLMVNRSSLRLVSRLEITRYLHSLLRFTYRSHLLL